MKKFKSAIILANLILLIGYLLFSVWQKERILSGGKLLLLELAPVDPRSLMQGDYMSLRYNIGEGESINEIPRHGFCVVGVQADGVAHKIRLQRDRSPLAEGEYLIPYKTGKFTLMFGAESFFFQEGQAEKFEKAKYGGLKVDESGNSLLVGLFDENKREIR